LNPLFAFPGSNALTTTPCGSFVSPVSQLVLFYIPIKTTFQVGNWVQRALNMGVDALRQEYRSLARYTLPEMTVEANDSCPMTGCMGTCCRYQDVPCQDQNRVVLKWHCAVTDYIHANYVATPVSEKRFILTQGPLDGTVNEFWQMVLQEEAETIIMLCNCIETGKNKCSPYWPDKIGETKQFNGATRCFQTRVLSPEELTVLVCILNMKYTAANVRHYQWQDWPDRGVPPCKLTSMELLSRVRGTTKPIVVHCSAGIGRTGTIVAIEYIMGKDRFPLRNPMNDLLKELRNQRAYTIQNDLQYLYIHRVMLCYFLEKHKNRYAAILTEENKAKYQKFVQDYNAATGT
uniref:Protein-tyrosine phosphatase n=1 Tax=Angiostrongylus costaricensis TaxID=334426 RepID=A0A0R3PLA1_ANGCS